MNEYKESMSDGADLIGVMVYWTGLHDARVSRPLWRQGIRQCGLGAALSDEPKPEAILNRAVGTANRRQTGDVGTKTKPGYAKLKRKDDDATYAVLMRRDVGDRMGYLEEATVTIVRDAHDPEPTVATEPGVQPDDARDALVHVIVDEYTEMLQYANTQEISETLVRAVRDTCSGLMLKAGFYIVRPDHLAALTDLEKFLADSCGATLELWEIRSSSRNASTAQRNANKSIRLAFTELCDEVKTFRDEHVDDIDGTPQKSLNARVERFKDLDAKVQLYADVLGDYRDELTAAIAVAKRELLGAFIGFDDVDAEAAA
jgi:hypothetical protein